MSSGRSFAVLQNNFLTNNFLNRYKVKDKDNPVLTYVSQEPIKFKLDDKSIVRKSHTNLRTEQGSSLPEIEGKEPYTIKLPFDIRAIAGTKLEVALFQLRLICAEEYGQSFTGKGITEYPYGYIRNGKLTRLGLAGGVDIDAEKKFSKDQIRTTEFVFYVPKDMVPVAINYRQNYVAKLPAIYEGENQEEN